MKKPTQAISTSRAFLSGADMSGAESTILKDIKIHYGFSPRECIWRSAYHNTLRIGAVCYKGVYKGKPSVLKIQGVKPEMSEIDILEDLSRQNKSSLIRPPILYQGIPWGRRGEWEGLILEHVLGEHVLPSGTLNEQKKISHFFDLYREYRENCLPQKPWLMCPDKPDWGTVFSKMINISKKAFPEHPLRNNADLSLSERAYKKINKVYENVGLIFLHGHFSVEDLIYQKGKVVLFSNLFWKWRYPFYDAVFGYHWCMFTLAEKEYTPQQVDKQRSRWLAEIEKLVENKDDELLMNTALLERAVAGILIDGFHMNTAHTISYHIFEKTREEVNRLLNLL